MSEQDKKDDVIESEVVNDSNTQNQTEHDGDQQKQSATKTKFNNDVLTRILVTLLFALIGWVSLWVFGIVILVQFGFLLITGHLNKNLKAFCGELGQYLSDIIKYVGFQSDEKPFPFQGWNYDDDKDAENGEPAK